VARWKFLEAILKHPLGINGIELRVYSVGEWLNNDNMQIDELRKRP